jgi:hypothetical protein
MNGRGGPKSPDHQAIDAADILWGAKTRSRCKDVLVDQSAETITTLDANPALLGRRRN